MVDQRRRKKICQRAHDQGQKPGDNIDAFNLSPGFVYAVFDQDRLRRMLRNNRLTGRSRRLLRYGGVMVPPDMGD